MGKKPWEQFSGKTDNHIDVDTIAVTEEKKPWEKFAEEPVKKKDLTVSAPSSESGTTTPSSENSLPASEQQPQPSEKSGRGLIDNIFSGVYDLGRKAMSVFTNEAPATLVTERAIKQPTNFIDELIRKHPEKYAVTNEFASPETRRKFAEKIADVEYPGWREGKEVMTKEGKVIKTGGLFTESALRKKQELLSEAQKQKREGEKFTEGIPKTWEEAKSKGSEGITSYIGAAIGNGLGQIPLSAVTLGGSSYFMEKAGAYDEALAAIAKENGMTEEEVVKNNMDQPAKDVAHYVGLINGGIDLASSLFTVAKGVLAPGIKNIIKKQATEQFLKGIPKEILKRGAKAVSAPLIEYGTEFAQETNTQIAGQLAAGKTPEEITVDWNRSHEAGLQGLFGSAGVVVAGKILSPKETIEQAKSNIKSTDDQATIEQEAAKIIESVKQEPKTTEGGTSAEPQIKPTPQEGVTNENINELGSEETQAGLGTEVQEPGIKTGEEGSIESGGTGGLYRTEEVRSGENVPTVSEGTETLNQEEDAIRQQRPAEEVPRIGTAGENIAQGSEGIRPSEQGQETTGARKEEQRQLGKLGTEEEKIGEPSEVPVDEKGTQPIFFYGTLKNKDTLEEALGTTIAPEEHSAMSAGEKTTERGNPIFTPGGTKEVKGVVARLTPEQINIKLKEKWGEGKNYDLKSITLSDGTKALAFIDKKTARENKEVPNKGSKVSDTESQTKQVISRATELFDQIQSAEGAAKKRRLAQERRTLLEANPSVKYIDDNIASIYKQLEEKKLITKKGKCP